MPKRKISIIALFVGMGWMMLAAGCSQHPSATADPAAAEKSRQTSIQNIQNDSRMPAGAKATAISRMSNPMVRAQ